MNKTNDDGRSARFTQTRRGHLTALLAATAGGCLMGRIGLAATEPAETIEAAFAALEARAGGRLGVAVLDTATGARAGWRADERFAMCSTFKLLLAALILKQVDEGAERLDRAIAVTAADLTPHAPVTEKRVGGTMTVGELCQATITTSDNPAANLLLGACGGPPAVTAFVRTLGDEITRLDRVEPAMNNQAVAEGDLRDTTSPAAMAATMAAILLDGALTPASRETLTGWLKATETGPDRLRAGLPAGWVIGHKTGTGEDGPTNDIAIVWPPGRAPLMVAAYYDRKGRTMKENATVLAEVGRIVGAMG